MSVHHFHPVLVARRHRQALTDLAWLLGGLGFLWAVILWVR